MRRALTALLCCLLLTGCGGAQEKHTDGYLLYFQERNLRDAAGGGELRAERISLPEGLEPVAQAELLLTALQNSGADSAGCGHFNVSDAGVTSSEAPALPPGVHDAADIRENLVLRLLGDRLRQPVLNGFIWRFLYTRAIIAGRGIEFEGAYLEDELFLMEYFCHAKRLAIVAEPLYNYYWNAASATHRYMRDYPETFRRFMERKEALAGRYGLDAPL